MWDHRLASAGYVTGALARIGSGIPLLCAGRTDGRRAAIVVVVVVVVMLGVWRQSSGPNVSVLYAGREHAPVQLVAASLNGQDAVEQGMEEMYMGRIYIQVPGRARVGVTQREAQRSRCLSLGSTSLLGDVVRGASQLRAA